MSSLAQMLLEQLTNQQSVGRLSRQVGADPTTTQNAVGAALPVLLSALAKNTAQTSGAEALERALGKHDGGVMDNLGGFLDSPDVDDGNGILGHLLGGRRNAVETGVSKASGLDLSMVTKLLPILAPIVMGALGRQKRQQNLDAGALASMLGSERQHMEQSSPAAGMLGQLLDADGDGSIADDIAAKLGKGLLGGLFGGR
jgi:hypothetical protein